MATEYVTDPELLKQLNAPAETPAAESEYVTDPALLAQLNGTAEVAPTMDREPVAVPGYVMTAPTGAAQLVGELRQAGVFEPITEALSSRASSYIAKPAKAVIDAATMLTTGIPGAAPMAAYDVYQAGKEALPRARQALGNLPNVSEESFRLLADKLSPKELENLGQLVKTGGGKAGLASFELPARLAQDAQAVAALQTLKAEAAAAPGMIRRLATPVLRGVAKVAGPAALGYDVYEAGQLARETQLGQRLAQGEGQFAPQAYRNLVNQNVSGYQPTPQEAANLLASGDQRTIQIYGGAKKLAEQAGQVQARPAQPSFIDNAMNVYQRYRGVAR